MVTTSLPAPEGQAAISPIRRIIGVFFSPKATFEDIARKPTWLAPLLLMAILGTSVSVLLNTKMNWGEYIRHKAEENARFSQLSEEQKEQALGPQIKFWSSFSYCVGAVAIPLSALCLGLIYWGAFNLFCGAGLRFGTAFAITSHAFVPTALHSVLALIILPLKPYGEVDPESIVATSVKAFLSDSAPKWLAALGGSLELFWIWFLVLVSIAFAAANPKRIKPATGFAVVFGLWGMWVLAKVAWAAI
jgi:hypothetical protein